MTSASSLAFPGSRTLATWWRQLAPFEPQRLCTGYLFLHRLEAPAAWVLPQPLDPLLALVLEALVLDRGAAAAPAAFYHRLHERLKLDIPVLRGLVRSLAAMQLIEAKSPPSPLEVSWDITEQGQQALRTKNVWSRQWKRGVFPFVERFDSTGHRLALPQYLRILDAPSSPWTVEEEVFDLAWLRMCLQQPTDWKETFGFPRDLVAFPEPAPQAETSVPWDRVVLDRAERLLVVFCDGLKPEEGLLGFGVRPEGWALNAAEPIVRLPAGACKICPELEVRPVLDLWKNAWFSWCQTRSVPSADANACSLSRVGECLHIEAPQPLIQYLQDGMSDVLKGETWLLAGEGYLRQAARLELVGKG